MKFASYELKKYAAQMGFEADIQLYVDLSPFDTSRFFRFDQKFDDAFEIKVKNGKGTIKATNERAVLIGVYHFFKCQGCRFLLPGVNGELIPRRDTALDVDETWYAKTRHRGVTDMAVWGVETGVDNEVEYIDWLPKMAMNTLFIELEDTYPTMQEHYSEGMGPYRDPVSISKETFDKSHNLRIAELKKRHLIYHNVGHGWTIRMMDGIDKISFREDFTPCKNTEILALTEGKRQVFRNKPMWTNLCYSQEKVRKDMARLVYEYSERHPETDVIHFWCADYFGNWCQCEECKKKRPSDWYVMILNEIDKVFTEHGNNTKIVFLVYFELAYAPIVERINNPDRFILMFAPYGRNFTQAYRESKPMEYEPKLNNDFDYKYMDMNLYLKQLEDWKKVYDGDSFSFDYIFYDNSYYQQLCQVDHTYAMYLDCVDIKNYGLNGKIECGNGRGLTPTAFPFHAVFGELFYGNTDYDKLYKDYFESSYGENQKVSELLEETAKLLPKQFLLCKNSSLTDEEKSDVKKALDILKRFKPYFDNYMPDEKIQRYNCRLFREFLAILTAYIGMIDMIGNGASHEELKAKLQAFKELLFRTESIATGYISANFAFVRLEQAINNAFKS